MIDMIEYKKKSLWGLEFPPIKCVGGVDRFSPFVHAALARFGCLAAHFAVFRGKMAHFAGQKRRSKTKVGSGEPPISGKNNFTRRQKFDFLLKLSFSLLDGRI